MNLLGLQITRSAPRLRVPVTSAFANRTLTNQVHAANGTRPVDVPTNMTQRAPSWSYNQSQDNLEERAINGDPRELWYLALPNKLTPQQCLQILRAALGGDIWQQWQLYSLMQDTWPTFRMALHQLREAVAYTKYNVIPYAEEGEEPSKSAKEKAGLVSRAIKAMEPSPFNDERGFSGMVYDLADSMANGMAMVELIWQTTRLPKKGGTELMPRAAAWVHPRHWTFGPNGEIAITDDNIARNYGMLSFANKNTLKGGMNPDKFLMAQFMSRSGSALGAGFMRPLVWYWAARQFNQEWMLNTAKQYGSPFIDITYKPGVSDQEERNKLAAFMKNAGPERRLIHPEGTVAQIHPPTSMGADNPQRYLSEEADRMCLFLLLGQETTTKSIPGQLGGQDAKQDIKEERVVGLATWLARNPLRQFARAIINQNYDETSECPELMPDRTRPLNSVEVGGLVSSITMSGLPVRADEFYKKINFTQPEPGDTIMQRGEITEMLTDEEKFAQQLEQQQAMAEMQQTGPGAEQNIQARETPSASRPSLVALTSDQIRAKLTGFTPHELLALEQQVTAAERAASLNGEWDEIKAKLEERS